MASITSVQDGDWSDTATWDTGTVPTSADLAIIAHAVTISADITVAGIRIDTDGSLTVADSYTYGSLITVQVTEFGLVPQLNDTRVVRLDGVLFHGVRPAILCSATGLTPAMANNVTQNAARDVIITDPGYIGTSATLQDIKPEGSGRAYARKVSNSVRYLTVTVRIRASMPHYLGRLYRMAESPYQVLLVTDRSIIKGYIETIAPDQSAVGTGYISVKVTVAEGL